MATSDATGRFIEYNDFSLVLARTRGQPGACTLEELKEVPLDNAAAVAEALQATFPESGEKPVSAVVLLRPKQRQLTAASNLTAAEWLAKPEFADWQNPVASTVAAKDGNRNVAKGVMAAMAAASNDSLEQARTALTGWKVEPSRLIVAPFATAGAVAAARQKSGEAAPVLILECGEQGSHLLLVSRNGLLAARALALTLDDIAEAVRSELGLKFKGAATKLFFNENYDFSDAGTRIAAQLAPKIKAEITAMAGNTPPTAFFCAGMPAKQDWFGDSLAGALELPKLSIDLAAWNTSAGLTIGNSSLTLSTTWLGLLHAAASKDQNVWLAGWGEVAPSGAPASAAPAAAAAPAKPAAAPAAKPAVAPVTPVNPAKAVTPPTPAPAAKPAAPAAPVAPAKPTTPAPAAKPATPTPAPVAKPMATATPAIKPAPVSTTKTPTPATPVAKTASAPLPPAKPVTPAPKSAAVSYSPAPAAAPAAKPSFIKTPAGMGAIAAVVLLIAVGVWFMASSNKQKTALQALEQQTELAAQQAKQAQEKAAQEAAARKKTENELNAKLLQAQQEAEAAKKQVEEINRQKELDRLANAKGNLVINTEPSGATVTVGNLPPRTTPATFTDLKIGAYPISITLARYGDASLNADVLENQTTNPGVIRLQRISCSLELACEPTGSAYEIRPAGLSLNTETRRGTTPALLSDLDAGEYVVVFRRQGWPDRETKITLKKGASERIAWAFPRGNITINSTPSGAKVLLGDRELGSTPLTVRDLPLGNASFDLTMPGFDPVTIDSRIEDGRTATASAMLTSSDRIVKPSELDEKPAIISSVTPELTREMRQKDITVQVSLVVGRDGSPRELSVLTATQENLKQACLEAAKKWRFKPGMIKGRPVNTRISIPFKITAVSETTESEEPTNRWR